MHFLVIRLNSSPHATRQNPKSTDSFPTSPRISNSPTPPLPLPHFLHVHLRVLGHLECKRRKIKCDRCDALRFSEVLLRKSLISDYLFYFLPFFCPSVDPPPEYSPVDRVHAVESMRSVNGTRWRPSERFSTLFPRFNFMFSSRAFGSDKYVTRAEYEQLKARVDQLESILLRSAGAGHVHMQPSMASAPTLPPGAGPSNPSYGHHGRSTPSSYGLGHGYGSDPYSGNARHPVTTLPPSSRTMLSGEINPPVAEREISSSRQYHTPHRPVSRQSRSTLGPVTAVPSYGSTEGTDERPKKRSAWTQQGVRPRKSCRAVDLVRQSQLCNILLPFLFLLAHIIIHLLTLRPLPLALLRSCRWKSLPITQIGRAHV